MLHPIIEREVILKRAGRDAFQRGLGSFEAHRVMDYQFLSDKATGRIDDFDVVVRYHGNLVDGQCSCPDSDGFEFCHHCVELVLHGNRVAQQVMSLSKGPDKSKVYAFLLGLDKQTLAKQMLGLLEADQELFDRYILRASLSVEQIDFAELKSRVTDVTRVEDKRNLFSQRQMKAFYGRIDQLFAEFEAADLEAHPAEGLKLVEYCIQRLNQLRAKIEDKWHFFASPAQRLQRLFQALFAKLEGRSATIVKRLEKNFYQDRYAILGERAAPYLAQFEEAESLFYSRAQELWRSTNVREIKRQTSAQKNLSQLPSLKEHWQWRKLAQEIVDLSPPEFARKNDYLWRASLREFLIQSPVAWMEWLDDLQTNYGQQKALERAICALEQFPGNVALVCRAMDLCIAQNDSERLELVSKGHAAAVAEWLDQASDDRLQRYPEQLLAQVYREIAEINPHKDPEERQYHALVQLFRTVQRRYSAELALLLGKDERLLVDHRIALARLLDKERQTKYAKQVREKLLPFLLSRNQNRCDDLAAEQTVLLRRNYDALGLKQSDFDSLIERLDPLISQRHNFARLVEKYS